MSHKNSAPKLLPLLLGLLSALTSAVYPQQGNLTFETVMLDEGAPTLVWCMLQDQIGFLWFGTWSGLYKYDGYNFTPYKHEPADSSSLIDNSILALFEDKAGVLWVGSRVGLDKLDRASGTFTHYAPNPSAAGSDPRNSIWHIGNDGDSSLWIASGDGLCRFSKLAGVFTFARGDTSDPWKVPIHRIYEDREGTVWFGTATGLAKYDREAGKFKYVWRETNYTQTTWFSSTSIYLVSSICRDENGVLWLGTHGGLVELNAGLGTSFVHCYPSGQNLENRFTSISQDVASGVLWLGSPGGLFSFDRKTKTFTRRLEDGIASVLSERSGTLWAGTPAGLKKLTHVRPLFKKYPMKDVACAIVNGSNGTLWIFGYITNGWLRFDPEKEQFIPYSFGTDRLYYVYPEGDLAFLKRDGSFYIRDTLGNTRFFLGPSWKDFNSSFSFGWKTRKGYYVGTHMGGLYLFGPEPHHVRKVRDFGQSIYIIYEDTFELLWVATRGGGLFCYDQAIDTLATFLPDAKNPSSIVGREINQIHQDKTGRLWFATVSGLERYDRSTKGFTHFTMRDGLPTNNIRGILEDDHGTLWLNTSKGIVKFDPEGNLMRCYDISYGVEPASDTYYGFGCRAMNGEMFFGGTTGFTRFHPDSIHQHSFIPPIVITSFRKFDKPAPFSNDLRLPYNENFISFEFAALSFINPERNQYAYKMEGVDREWVYSGSRRYASYPNLNPGEYLFRVKGSNSEGVWNDTGVSVAIMISPPWWKTAWAYVLFALTLMSTGYYFWRLQVKRIRSQHEFELARFEAAKLREVDELKSRFFANISHEFRTPLTLILGPVRELIDQSEQAETRQRLQVLHRNAARLLGLVNQLLDLSKLESGSMKLHATPLDIVGLVRGFSKSFSSYADRKRISLSVSSDRESVVAYVDQEKLEKILTNVLSNAFKFTPEGGRIEVSVTSGETNVTISVRDTGIGIPAEKIPWIFNRFYQVDGSHTREQEGTGIGLSLTRELVELHRGTIDVESEEGKGTMMTIRIPLGTKHLHPEEISSQPVEVKKLSDQAEAIPRDIDTETPQRRFGPLDKSEQPVVLVVEDNADVREYIRRNLRGAYQVIEAGDGADGWSRSLEQMPDVIVSDVMMPKMDGFALCDRVKTDERTSHIPVILLTAKASTQDKIEGFATGADDYIVKPFEPAEIRARIQNLIEQRKRIHEHFRKHGLIEVDETKITPVDQKFLQKALTVINERMSDPTFGVEALAEAVAVSKSVLLKKSEALVGEPPSELIKRLRLDRAGKLIEARFGNITEIALEVGFSNPSYFAECFRKHFGTSPSRYHGQSQ